MKTMIRLLTVALLCVMISMPADAREVAELVYMTEEYRPFNYSENGELKGISVDLLKLMWAEMKSPPQLIKLLPWARGYQFVQTRKNHVLFAMSRTEERNDLFKWVGPLYTAKFVLVARSHSDIALKSIDDAKSYRIGTIREDVSEQILTAAGININKLDRIADIAQNIRKLRNGRIDLISYSQRGFTDSLKVEGLNPADFKTVLVIKETQSYYAFHKDTPDTLILKFQDALNRIKNEHQAILDKYLDE